MKKWILSLVVFVHFSNLLTAQNIHQTVAESSDYQSTSRYEAVLKFVRELDKNFKSVRVEMIGNTMEGREIPLLIVANPMPKNPQELKNDKRIKVYIEANIHAGEIEGKEASLMYVRDMLQKEADKVLKDAVLLVCPILNADGNERISKQNRVYQPGPVNGVGVRHNAQFLDLNRDAMKLESAEIQGVVQNILNRWDPEVTMDCHTTNGVYRQEPTTFSWMVNPNGDRGLRDFVSQKWASEIQNTLREKYEVDNCYFGEFVNLNDSTEVYMEYAHEPRYLVNYVGLRNRISILNENYVYADYKTRVNASYHLIKTLVEKAIEHKKEIKLLIQQADENALKPTSKEFSFDYKPVPLPENITIKTYKTEFYTDQNGRKHEQPTTEKQTLNIPYYADFEFNTHFQIPYAYLFSIRDPRVLENLKMHGIQLHTLTQDVHVEIEKFEIESLLPATRLNQGHYTNKVTGKFVSQPKEFKDGTYVVFTNQPLSKVLVYLLEPLSDDGLMYWNFWDKYLVPQWGNTYFDYPVYKLNYAVVLPAAAKF